MKNNLTESLEKYLLAIFEIVKEKQAARVKDVAKYLNVGGPSTSDAIKALTIKGYINYEPYGVITLTKKGISKAEEKIRRHNIIANFLSKVLLLSENEIEINAQKIEYSMPKDVLDKFISYLEFMENCSCKEPKWLQSYHYFAKNGKMKEKCQICANNKEKFDNSNCCGGCIKK